MMDPITAFYAALSALWLLLLALRVVWLRQREDVGFGDGDRTALALAIRVHANAVEYVPVALILMLVWESNHAPPGWLNAAGIGLLLGRLLHAWGLSRSGGRSAGRLLGTLLTWLVIAGLALVNLLWLA